LNRRPIEEPQRQDFYKAMLQDVDRLDKVITQLLDVARLSHRAEESSVDISPVRVDVLVKQILEEVQLRYAVAESETQEHQPVPVVSLDLEPVIVQGMFVDLDMLFRNLIDNAFKYGGKPCTIDITVHFITKTNRLLATITDNGNGIPRSMRRRIFNRFFRIGDELERTKPGIGLGLFLVRNVIRRLKGMIAIVDIPGHSGTRFEISLPNATKVAPDENL